MDGYRNRLLCSCQLQSEHVGLHVAAESHSVTAPCSSTAQGVLSGATLGEFVQQTGEHPLVAVNQKQQ